jgi:acetoin utilization deacetylase AcuC-like enzyme
MEAIIAELSDFKTVSPTPATDEDVLLIHTEKHLLRVKADREQVYDIALLAAGGAVLAAEHACQLEPIFAVIRPPGHHASPEGYWGFCYFNNIAIAVKKTIKTTPIQNAIILDFDLHFGDGSNNSFRNDPRVTYYACEGRTSEIFIDNMKKFLDRQSQVDLLAVSAGFDRHVEDWGGLLTTEDYNTIGKILKGFSEEKGANRRFACLEGGYNHNVLGKNVRSFIDGFY